MSNMKNAEVLLKYPFRKSPTVGVVSDGDRNTTKEAATVNALVGDFLCSRRLRNEKSTRCIPKASSCKLNFKWMEESQLARSYTVSFWHYRTRDTNHERNQDKEAYLNSD